ncbi:MAG: MarR family transcriptional regulator [Brevibacterium sp.]|nr:MarR family transcriptional regulator [Brevibacterium sp.]
MSQESIARRESASPQALDAMIGYQLKHLQSALRSHMDEALRPIGLSTPQYACLELLRREPGASNSELARGAFVTRQTMSTLLRGLQDR